MSKIWRNSSYLQRVNILVGFGSDYQEADHLAQQDWGDLPLRLRRALKAEYGKTGDPA
jgi:hypothetical protein